MVNCNWLQIMENSVDAVHTEWLHGKFYEFIKESDGVKVSISKHHVKIGFDEFQHGIIKRRVLEGHTEEDDDWKIGHPLLFPNTLAIGNAGDDWHEYRFQIPRTDRRHAYAALLVQRVRRAEERQAFPSTSSIASTSTTCRSTTRTASTSSIRFTPKTSWRGRRRVRSPIARANRSTPPTAGSRSTAGCCCANCGAWKTARDPKSVLRDPAQNHVIDIPLERKKAHRAEGFEDLLRRHQIRYAPIADELIAIFSGNGVAS